MNSRRFISGLEKCRAQFDGPRAWRALLLLLTSLVVASPRAARSNSQQPPRPEETAGAVPATFFGTSAVRGTYPKVMIGTLAHQEFAWDHIEGEKRKQFDFKLFDGYVSAAQQQGLVDPSTNTANVVITLAAGTPHWAASSCSAGAACTVPPDNIDYWTEFVTAVVQHYNGKPQPDGTIYPHIKFYELWNEFNVPLWWTGSDSDLVALAKAAYPIIHQDPYSMLLTPSVAGPASITATSGGIASIMAAYLQAGGAQYADGGAFHGYPAAPKDLSTFPNPEDDSTEGCLCFYGSIVTKATQMRAIFDQNGLAGKPMFQTEGSWGNNTVTDPVAWVARYNLLQAGLRSSLNLQLAAWFTWADPSFGWGNIADSSLNPTAAGIAYSQVYGWVVGATIDAPCIGGADGTWKCNMTRPGGYQAQAVWNTQGPAQFTPGAGYSQYRDLAGNTVAIAPGAAVAIGAKPILVESGSDTVNFETAKQKASGKLIVYATSTNPSAVLNIKAFPLLPMPNEPSIDLGSMAKTSASGNEFFIIKKNLGPIVSVQITSSYGGSSSAQVKH